MIIAQGKDGINKMLIYQKSVLTLSKDDSLTFIVGNEHLEYKIKFTFTKEGEKYSTTFWENVEEKYLHYQLNNWDDNTYVEVGVPVEIKLPQSESKIWMKFRNYSPENKNQRKFEISIWKEVKDGK